MSRRPITSLALGFLSLAMLSVCQAWSPSLESKRAWVLDEPTRTLSLGVYPHPRIAQICLDDGYRSLARVIADRSRTYALMPGNCIDVEASDFELASACSAECASKPLGSGTFEVVHGVLPPKGAWVLADGNSQELIHLLDARFYEFCNRGPYPVRLFSDYRITDRDVREGTCGAVRGRDIGVRSSTIGSGPSGAYKYVE